MFSVARSRKIVAQTLMLLNSIDILALTLIILRFMLLILVS